MIYSGFFLKTLRFLVDFVPKKRHLISQIRLKFGREERQKISSVRAEVHNKLPNFALKARNFIGKDVIRLTEFVENFGNSEQTSEPARPKWVEIHCKFQSLNNIDLL